MSLPEAISFALETLSRLGLAMNGGGASAFSPAYLAALTAGLSAPTASNVGTQNVPPQNDGVVPLVTPSYAAAPTIGAPPFTPPPKSPSQSGEAARSPQAPIPAPPIMTADQFHNMVFGEDAQRPESSAPIELDTSMSSASVKGWRFFMPLEIPIVLIFLLRGTRKRRSCPR